ncbi:DNA-directed DNA polymerase [Tanacetum coccineum]|uniref:DNA-directed DNA polymerase n=1 Tax=Tanacetum coccineum TaxID=301880 RepID=A0ABQ4Z5F2_9ASTR
MTRSTVKRLTKPLDEPERELRRRRKAALRSHQNESLAIVERDLFDDEASSSHNTRAKPITPPKTLHKHSHLNSSNFLNPITYPTKKTGRIVDSREIWLIQNTCTFQGLKNEDPLCHIRHYFIIVDNIQADGVTRDTSRLRFFHFSLKGKAVGWLDRIPPTQTTTWEQLVLKKQKKVDEDEQLLSIFKQIHVNLPFLEAMIHMPKGAKVLKDLLSHKEKLEKAASSVKLSEKWISKLKPTKMSIQLAYRSIKYPIGVYENLLVKISKFIFPIDFVVLEMDEDELVPIILGRPFLATARAVIDVHEGKLSLRVESETVTFNIGKSMKSKHSHDDYLYCANRIAKLVQEQWVDTVNHDGEWTEEKEGDDPNKVLAVSFYPRTELV